MLLVSVPRWAAVSLVAFFCIFAGGASVILGTCGPFTDTANDVFCPFVLEIFYLGITTGTTSTTYDPTANVNRTQMAAFLSRTVDRVLLRGSKRAALGEFWTAPAIGTISVGPNPRQVKSDGTDVWVADETEGSVRRVRGSDMKLLDTWTGATNARGLMCLVAKVVVTGETSPGQLYLIDPLLPPGAVTVLASNLGNGPKGVAYDGASRFWTANSGSVSIVTPTDILPWTVTTVTTGFNNMFGPTFDGNNIWVANSTNGTLLKLDATGSILLTVTVGSGPIPPLYDGTNLWVPNFNDATISIVRPGSGAVLATLTGNGLSQPGQAAFDGQRVVVTSLNTNTVSIWKAADLTPIGNFDIGDFSRGACSDGTYFWITSPSGLLDRF